MKAIAQKIVRLFNNRVEQALEITISTIILLCALALYSTKIVSNEVVGILLILSLLVLARASCLIYLKWKYPEIRTPHF